MLFMKRTFIRKGTSFKSGFATGVNSLLKGLFYSINNRRNRRSFNTPSNLLHSQP